MKQFVLFALLMISLCASTSAQEGPSNPPTASSSISYGLVVDNSGSFRLLLDRVIAVALEVIEQNRTDDEAFLVTFVNTEKIALRQELTSSKADLRDAAENMFIEGGQTAIVDALKSSADYLAQNSKSDRPRALVLITDGEDRVSRTRIEDLLKVLKEEKIRVVVVAMSDVKVVTKLIDRVARESGGKVFLPKTRADMSAAGRDAAATIRAQQ